MWTDIAGIVFVCVTMNHMGLVSAAEETIGRQIPIINCPKCLTFWSALLYCHMAADMHIIQCLAISFLSSYAAIWLELTEAITDTLYLKLYDTIREEDNEHKTASDSRKGNPKGSVS